MRHPFLGTIALIFSIVATSTYADDEDLSREAALTTVKKEALAQETKKSAELAELRSQSQRSLKKMQVCEGNHQKTFNLIARPSFRQKNSARRLRASAAEDIPFERYMELLSKKEEVLSISVTVYDEEITELVLYDDRGRRIHFFVNMNFSLLQGLGSLETADTVYQINAGFGVGERNTETSYLVPEMEDFKSSGIEFLLAPDSDPLANKSTFKGVIALCRHYIENQAALEKDYRRRKELEAARRHYRETHPEVQREIIFNFWKK